MLILVGCRCELLQQDQGQQADVAEECEQRLHSAHSMLQACRHEAEQAAAQLQVRRMFDIMGFLPSKEKKI